MDWDGNTRYVKIFCGVVDPDPEGSEPFCKMRIRINSLEPDPELKGKQIQRIKTATVLSFGLCLPLSSSAG